MFQSMALPSTIYTINNTQIYKTRLSLLIYNKPNKITWISPKNLSPENNQKQLNLSKTTKYYLDVCTLINSLIQDTIPNSSSNTRHSLSAPFKIPTPPSSTTQTYLDALRSSLPNQDSSVHPTEATTLTEISSLSTSTAQIKLLNMQEHLTRSITILQKEFKQFKTTLREEIKNQIDSAVSNLQHFNASSYETYNNITPSLPNELQASIMSAKNDITNFQNSVQESNYKRPLLTPFKVPKLT